MKTLSAIVAWMFAFLLVQPPLTAQYVQYGYTKSGGGGGIVAGTPVMCGVVAGGATSCSMNLSVTSGHKIIVAMGGVKTFTACDGGSCPGTSTDTFTQFSWSPTSDSNGLNSGAFYAQASTTGTINITCGFGSTTVNNGCWAQDVSGLQAGNPLDQSGSNQYASSTTPATGSLTTALTTWESIAIFPLDQATGSAASTNCSNLMTDTSPGLSVCYSVQSGTQSGWVVHITTSTSAFGTATVMSVH